MRVWQRPNKITIRILSRCVRFTLNATSNSALLTFRNTINLSYEKLRDAKSVPKFFSIASSDTVSARNPFEWKFVDLKIACKKTVRKRRVRGPSPGRWTTRCDVELFAIRKQRLIIAFEKASRDDGPVVRGRKRRPVKTRGKIQFLKYFWNF